MENYHRVLFRVFIDQPPKYNTPPPCASPVQEMKALKPSSKTVAFHRHGKEVAVTLSGNNLWFCHEIKVGPHKENVMADHISQKAIQFNFKDETHHSFGSDQIKVTLSSHFSNPVKATVPVVHKVTRCMWKTLKYGNEVRKYGSEKKSRLSVFNALLTHS